MRLPALDFYFNKNKILMNVMVEFSALHLGFLKDPALRDLHSFMHMHSLKREDVVTSERVNKVTSSTTTTSCYKSRLPVRVDSH